MRFKTTPVEIPLMGHGLPAATGGIAMVPKVTGTFAADPVSGPDGTLYADFTIPEPVGDEYPFIWAGTYRLYADSLLSAFGPDPGTIFEEL